jgi:hypothetical protein
MKMEKGMKVKENRRKFKCLEQLNGKEKKTEGRSSKENGINSSFTVGFIWCKIISK